MRSLTTLEKAIQYASIAHGGVMRKVGNIPYLMHPLEAAVIAASLTADQDVMAAALLHDTIEDTNTTEEDIREKFGEKITQLVLSETEDKMIEYPAHETWKRRKEMSLEVLRNTNDENVKILWLADKLSNMRSFYRQHCKEGDDMWMHYHQKNKDQQEWYYRSIAECLDELKDSAAYEEYCNLLNRVFEAKEGV